ncbi:MAG: hypothetical protein JF586_08915 [Burkholderiales bacterium]|nr:hypothetical protein [Burkholderiales bacterium]
MSAVVLIPTTGAPSLRRAVESVLAQTAPTAAYVVCDGPQFHEAAEDALRGLDVPVCVLPRNVGAGGFYGHRVYAAFAHLVDARTWSTRSTCCSSTRTTSSRRSTWRSAST